MDDPKWPKDVAGNHTELLTVVNAAIERGADAYVRLVLLPAPETREWLLACGRIDLARKGDVELVPERDYGTVRTVEQLIPGAEFVRNLSEALQGHPFQVGELALRNHGFDRAWEPKRISSQHNRYHDWPALDVMTPDVPERPSEPRGLLVRTGQPTCHFDDLTIALTKFRGDGRAMDGRKKHVFILILDYRGRIRAARRAGNEVLFELGGDALDQAHLAVRLDSGRRLLEPYSAVPEVRVPVPAGWVRISSDLVLDAAGVPEVLDQRFEDLPAAQIRKSEGDDLQDDVNRVARDKLRVLRQRLAALEPYPWDPIEAWSASAKPLIKAYLGEHVSDFTDVTTAPTWQRAFYVSSAGISRRGTRPQNNFARADARKQQEDRKLAVAAKQKILAFVDGLLDLPSSLGPDTIQPGAARTMSRDAVTLSHDEIHALRSAVISARLTGSRDALLAHISPEFVASLPVAAVPGQQVLMDLDALNGAGELADGSMPLAVWLKNAVQLSGGRREEKVFTEALERVQPGAARLVRAQSKQSTSSSREAEPAAAVVHHHHGEVHMGSKFTTNITGSTVGAFAQGDGAVATGHVTIGAAGALTQAQHQEHIKAAKKALADDEERLDAKVYEALEKFLKQAREVKVEARPVGEVQDEMDGILERVWVEHREKTIDQRSNVIGALEKSPVMVGVTKKLLGS